MGVMPMRSEKGSSQSRNRKEARGTAEQECLGFLLEVARHFGTRHGHCHGHPGAW